MEEPVQATEEDTRLRVPAVTPVIPFSVEKNIIHKTKSDTCKIQKPEQVSIIVDYTKLHKQYLKLSKIRLTCKYAIQIY